MNRFVRVTTGLPLPAEFACTKAGELETMEHVLSPLVGFKVSDQQRAEAGNALLPGANFSARLVFLGILPVWTHHLSIVSVTPTEIYTNERSGPVKTWNHRLIFEPTGPTSCRYTDEIETDGGLIGLFTAGFVQLVFRHRQRRWRKMAADLAADLA